MRPGSRGVGGGEGKGEDVGLKQVNGRRCADDCGDPVERLTAHTLPGSHGTQRSVNKWL